MVRPPAWSPDSLDGSVSDLRRAESRPGQVLLRVRHAARLRGVRAERRVVTALFCDLVGSTALGEAHDPEVLEPLLARYFDDARAAEERHGGRAGWRAPGRVHLPPAPRRRPRREIEPVIAKGKAQPLRAWRLLEVLTGAQGIARHLDSPLVGRTRERALLADALARAVGDEGVQLRSRRRGAAAGRPVGRGRRLGGSASVRRGSSRRRAAARLTRKRPLPNGSRSPAGQSRERAIGTLCADAHGWMIPAWTPSGASNRRS